ncbi:MAG: Rpn family recombination-promoting nuclease/putative transposase [Muribaculaceae bacterium]|nr:Rpn family recombination-promoting nuclease/putative transposase [Muribaculaceae bacterium]
MDNNQSSVGLTPRDNSDKYGVFVNPFVDEGFKIIFGQEEHKDILINVLNIIFDGEVLFKDITYIDKEIPRGLQSKRGIVFDLLCETDKGEKVLVEMQNKRQSFFEQRAAYYIASALARQGKAGDGWFYNIKRVYGVFFLNFNLPGRNPRLRIDLEKRDRHTGEVFDDYMRMTYIMFPQMKYGSIEECEDNFERIIFILKNMKTMEYIPGKEHLPIIEKLEQVARLGALSDGERLAYDRAVDAYRVEQDAWKTAIEEGREIGREEGREIGREIGLEEGRQQEKLEMARKLKALGVAIKDIISASGLSETVVLSL